MRPHPPDSIALLLEWTVDPAASNVRRHHQLTAREHEVLGWLAAGKSDRDMGLILGISTGTVGKHLERIYQKLGVENRTAAASFYHPEFERRPRW